MARTKASGSASDAPAVAPSGELTFTPNVLPGMAAVSDVGSLLSDAKGAIGWTDFIGKDELYADWYAKGRAIYIVGTKRQESEKFPGSWQTIFAVLARPEEGTESPVFAMAMPSAPLTDAIAAMIDNVIATAPEDTPAVVGPFYLDCKTAEAYGKTQTYFNLVSAVPLSVSETLAKNAGTPASDVGDDGIPF